jgi:uncharacterized coiled-coil protein SlyX
MNKKDEIKMLKEIVYKHSKRIHNLEEQLRELVEKVVGTL